MPIVCFVVAYIVANLSILGVIKVGNAVFAFVCMAITTPLTEFAFTFKWIMGADAEQTRWYVRARRGDVVLLEAFTS